jgi:hypothetical protein
MTGILPDDRTTDKRPAFPLVSRPYHIGYNDLENCRYRRLVMLERLRLNSYLPPFKEGKRSGQSFIRIQFLRCFLCFQLHYLTIIQIEIFQELAIMSVIPRGRMVN